VAGSTLTVGVAGNFGVPAAATAVVVDVIAVNPSATGYVTVFPSGQAPPTASNLNATAATTVSNLVHVGLGGGHISVFSVPASDVVIDVEGYVTAPEVPAGAGLYDPLAGPVRVCDTRSNNPSGLSGPAAQCDDRRLAADSSRVVSVAGSFAVPANATAVVANLTVVNPSSFGYATAYPDGLARPTASNVNYTAGQTIPNRVIVPLGADGNFDVYSYAATDVVIDISGYYTAPGGTGSKDVAAGTPTRICDTRAANPSGLSGDATQCSGRAPGPSQSLSVNVAAKFGIPADATAVIVNVTAIAPTAGTYLTVYPSGVPPTASDLNPSPGETEPNLVLATVASDGTIKVYNNLGVTDVAIDVTGWYVPAPQNQSGPGLPRLARALARVASGTGDMKLLYIGDSTTYGYGATPNGIGPTLSAAQHLVTAGYPAALGLSVPGHPGLPNVDPRWVANTGWTKTANNTATWGGANAAWVGNSPSGTLTFTPGNGYSFDTFDIWYLVGPFGTVNANVDGGPSTLINCNGPPGVAKTTITAPAGSAHVVNLSGVSGGVEIIGIEPSLSTVSKVRVANAGVAGATTAGWTTTDTTNAGYSPLDSIAAYAPDVSLIRLGINDANSLGMPLKTYLANLLVLANTAKATGDVIISSPTPVRPPAIAAFLAVYAAALPAFCAANGFAYIPQFDRWGGLGLYAALNPIGYYNDVLHPSATGYADIATADVAAVLAAR